MRKIFVALSGIFFAVSSIYVASGVAAPLTITEKIEFCNVIAKLVIDGSSKFARYSGAQEKRNSTDEEGETYYDSTIRLPHARYCVISRKSDAATFSCNYFFDDFEQVGESLKRCAPDLKMEVIHVTNKLLFLRDGKNNTYVKLFLLDYAKIALLTVEAY